MADADPTEGPDRARLPGPPQIRPLSPGCRVSPPVRVRPPESQGTGGRAFLHATARAGPGRGPCHPEEPEAPRTRRDRRPRNSNFPDHPPGRMPGKSRPREDRDPRRWTRAGSSSSSTSGPPGRRSAGPPKTGSPSSTRSGTIRSPLFSSGEPPEEESIGRSDRRQETGVPWLPFLDVPEILASVQSAALVVSGDTFALQAACALGVPRRRDLRADRPRRNGPFRSADKIVYHPISCSLCYRRDCESTECLDRVKPDEVLALIKSYVRENA